MEIRPKKPALAVNSSPIPELRKKRSRRSAVAVLVIILLAGAAVYYFTQAQKLKTQSKTGASDEGRLLIERVSKLIVLPTDEQPTIATVSDPEQLRGQPFFSRAKRGDKVLIYTNARKAILYDPAANKIVEVAPLNIGGTKNSGTSTLPAL